MAPAARRRFGPDAPALPEHDALHGGQPDAGARELVGAVQPLEGAEQLVGVLHVEPHTVIAHEEHALPVLFLAAELDLGDLSFAR